MLKVKGLKKIAGESKELNERYSLQVNYNMKTGEAWFDQNVGCSWVQYNDRDILNCGTIEKKCTMAEIRDIIETAVMHAV